jgi:hypothetical protein
MRVFFATLLVAALPGAPAKTLHAADDPLARVPPSASVFAHLRVADVWNSPIGQEVRKAAGKDLEKPLGEFQKEVGLPIDHVDTATFCYPNFPQGPGDQQQFIVIVTTVKPYDRDGLMPNLRKKDAKAKGNQIQLQDKFTLSLVSDTMFMVMHDSLVAKFAGAPIRDEEPPAIAEALKLARDKHQLVLAMDFSKLPNELFTAGPPQLQPFLPLLKAKTSNLFADLKPKGISVGANFVAADANAAEEAERSFKLLMKLATDGLADVQKDKDAKKEIGAYLPLLKELQGALNGIHAVRTAERLALSMTVNSEQPIGELVTDYVKRTREESGRAMSTNNLRQIGIAMHNYHNTHNGFPPAAICDKKGKPLLSWRVAILPYVEQQSLYNEFKLDEPWDSEHNRKLIAKMPKVYADNDKSAGKTHYRVFQGNNAVFDQLQPTRLQDIADGTSQTLMVADLADSCDWTKPDDIEFNDKLEVEKLLRFTNDRTTIALCDGSVRTIKKGKGDQFWRALITKNGGEAVNLDD